MIDTFADDTRAMRALTSVLERELGERFAVCRTADSHRVFAYAYFKLAADRYVRIDLSEIAPDNMIFTASLVVQREHVGDPESFYMSYRTWDSDMSSVASVHSADAAINAIRGAIADARR